jgi:hypothetical protein
VGTLILFSRVHFGNIHLRIELRRGRGGHLAGSPRVEGRDDCLHKDGRPKSGSTAGLHCPEPRSRLGRQIESSIRQFGRQKKTADLQGVHDGRGRLFPGGNVSRDHVAKVPAQIPRHARNLANDELAAIVKGLEDPDIRAKVATGDGTTILTVFPSKKDQNPYAGSLVGLGNYPSLVHMTYAVAKAKGIALKDERSGDAWAR